MTKKDYELIAEAIKEFSDMADSGEITDRRTLAETFARKLKNTNLQFKRSKFIEACGLFASLDD